MNNDYYLGLDVGTNSVGWAVTKESYEICKFKKKSMWGIRLFEQAKTARDRRLFRNNRRRLSRKKERIDLLQEIFSKAMAQKDETFFLRLNESRLHLEDKFVSEKYPLFVEKNYSDIDYYKEYPTIFHLRKALIENKREYDIRLVYLALHNILKYRGHFLIDGDLKGAKDFKFTFNQMLEILTDELEMPFELGVSQRQEFETILRDKNLAKSIKVKKLTGLFYLEKPNLDKEEYKRRKNIIEQVCKLIVGSKGDITKLFNINKEEVTKYSFSFVDTDYDTEIRPNLDYEIPKKSYLLDVIKGIYDWSVLIDILQNETYISFAKVKQYNKHKENLGKLKMIILKYCDKSEYNDFFNNEKGKHNYASYIGSVKKNRKKYTVKKTGEEEFYKKLQKILQNIQPEESDQQIWEELIEETKLQHLLPLQKSKDNASIPHQIYEAELRKILENASEYLPFLKENDEMELSNADKIIRIFLHRVPYYVGPLSNRHKKEGANVWAVRREGRENTRIYPWNMEQVIDYEKSNEVFIRRMTNKCTYLIGEDVLPKNSLLYSKYMVLNELNNLKVYGKKIPENTKQEIFRELFMNKYKVTGKAIQQYLKRYIPEITIEDLSGFDQEFKSSLKSYLDFKKQVFGDDIEKIEIQNMVEDIIRWITIYGNDKKMLHNMIEKVYPNRLTVEQLRKINSLRYSGWGNFSKKFLKGTDGTDKETGEVFTVIETLWNKNDNLMQLLSSRYTFMEEVENHNNVLRGEIKDISYETLVKDLCVSPANKRAIWQTIQLAEEIKSIMGYAPKRIFVEMARGEEKIKQKTKSRKSQLLELYGNCKEDTRNWLKEIENRDEREFNSLKLYLYYTQMGKCMYTGEPIDLEELMSGNSAWDRDHIYPQSRIKDDSLDNLVLVKKTINAKKTNEMLSSGIQKKMKSFWESLLELKLISRKKYDRLTRTGEFTDEELAGFINRQLVETRQSTKAIAEIFKAIYPKTDIVYVKARLISDFRKNPLNCLKSRRVNDYHHAKDAYLSIVVGNVYDSKFSSNPIQWMKQNRYTNYSISRVFDYDVYRGASLVWKASEKNGEKGTIDRVRKTMEKNNILYTEYSYCEKGELFDAMPVNKNRGSKIPLKAGLSTNKYGGYLRAKTAYFSLVEFENKKGKKQKLIIAVPLFIDKMLDYKPGAFIEYCQELQEMRNVRIIVPKIKKNSLFIVNGFPLRIRGESSKDLLFKGNLQLKVSTKIEKYIRNMEKYLEKNSQFAIDEKLDNISHEVADTVFDCLLEKMNTSYLNRPSNQYHNLYKNRELFYTANNLSDKVKFINEMITLLRCDIETKADLSFISGSVNAGSITFNKNTLSKVKVELVNQSVTGLFENRIQL